MKLNLIFIFLLLFALSPVAQNIQSNKSPYAFIGDDTKILEASYSHPHQGAYSIISVLADSSITTAYFDYKNRTIRFVDSIGVNIATDTIPIGYNAFTIVDPMATQYTNFSPYAYCLNDPITLIDPDGQRPRANEAALMAAYVYEHNSDSNIEHAQRDIYKDQLSKCGWEILNVESINNQNGLQSVIFERTIDGKTEYAYVFAGTNSIEDCLNDLTQLIGLSTQYHTAIENAKNLSNALANNELTFVGHSLGGGEAIASSMATGRAAITFNSAAVSKLTMIAENLSQTNNVVNYRTIGNLIGLGNLRIGGDPLNNIQEKIGLRLPGVTFGIPTGLTPTHGISNFLKYKLPEPK